MIKDALAFLSDQAARALTPKALEVADPRAVRFLAGDQLHTIPKPFPPRDHDVGTLDDLIALANRFKAAGASPVVWFGAEAVVLVIDDDGHRIETATLALEPSAVWKVLEGLAAQKPWLNQKQFVRLLRIDLAGTLDAVTLLNPVRDVRFENGSITSGTVARDRESLGRTITSAVKSGVGEIPEDVALRARVYATPGADAELLVRCSVEVEPADGTFRLLPLPDQLTLVQQVALSTIRATLAAELTEGIPAYHGKP